MRQLECKPKSGLLSNFPSDLLCGVVVANKYHHHVSPFGQHSRADFRFLDDRTDFEARLPEYTRVEHAFTTSPVQLQATGYTMISPGFPIRGIGNEAHHKLNTMPIGPYLCL